jgi:hypothetical protein
MWWRKDEHWLPDFDDPATLGCLLALVREAWGDPDLFVEREQRREPARAWSITTKSGPCTCRGGYWYGATEAEALVAALEAAP